jgi:hypothetical protein
MLAKKLKKDDIVGAKELRKFYMSLKDQKGQSL